MPKKQIRKSRPILAGFTDDSGVVISQKQYAELHGEPRTRKGFLSGEKPETYESPGTFARIARKGNPRKVECEYCHAIVPVAGIAYHTQSAHQTLELRFTPAKALESSKRTSALRGREFPIEIIRVKVLECEYCHEIHPWDEIGDHTRKKHCTGKLRFKAAGEREIPRRKGSKQKTPRSNPQNCGLIIEDMGEQSDGMAHFRREGNGQFGSYPLHDDYGDESSS